MPAPLHPDQDRRIEPIRSRHAQPDREAVTEALLACVETTTLLCPPLERPEGT